MTIYELFKKLIPLSRGPEVLSMYASKFYRRKADGTFDHHEVLKLQEIMVHNAYATLDYLDSNNYDWRGEYEKFKQEKGE